MKLSEFAYLRPTESRSANSRLFFGVEQKTQTKKQQDTENLKVPRQLHSLLKATVPIQD